MISVRQGLVFACVAIFLVSARPLHAIECQSAPGPPEIFVTADAQGARVGGAVVVHWTSKARQSKECRRPLFLVFAISGRVRFEGTGFIATPTGAKGPYDIADALEQTRVFIPLHALSQAASGSFKIKFFTAGPNTVSWFVSSLSEDFQDASRRKSTVIAKAKEPVNVTVEIGKPAIVVRDSFAPNIATGSGGIEHPKKRIVSNSNEFELQIFAKFYRVYDLVSGELVLERAGVEPNFSPTSRFIGAFTEGAGFEIIDLYADRVVLNGGELNRSDKYVGPVHIAAWGRGDGLVALSIWGWGGIHLKQTLIDGEGMGDGYGDCHACQGIGRPLSVDYDTGMVEFGGWASLHDAGVSSERAKVEADRKFPNLEFNEQIAQRRDAYESELNERMRAKTQSKYLATAQSQSLEQHEAGKNPWFLGEEAKFSHLCVPNNAGVCDWATDDPNRELSKFLIEHSGRSERVLSESKAADFRLIASRAAVPKGEGQKSAPSVLRWLRELGTPVNEGTQVTVPVAVWRDDELKDQPSEGDLSPIESVFASAEEMEGSPIPNFVDHKHEVTKIPLSKVTRVASWTIDQTRFWLTHSDCFLGNSSNKGDQYLQLVSRKGLEPARVVDLSTRLENSGILAKEVGSVNVEGHMWPLDFDIVTIADSRFLLLSGHWFLDRSRWALVYDLESDKTLLFKPYLPNAANIKSLSLTENQKHLVVTSSTGALYFYNLASGLQVLSGQYIDDELVIYDRHGHYVSTYEGSQFVFLKFAAMPGYFPFKQFEAALNRPDTIRLVYDGKATPSEPDLATPPQLAIETVQLAASDELHAKIVAKASKGLARLRLYFDGQLFQDRALAGSSIRSDETFEVPPQARWLTAVAIDEAGNSSLPQAVSIPSDTRASNRNLYVLAVGTDTYRYFPADLQLHYAASDARNFASTLQKLTRAYYRWVDPTMFLDTASLKTELPDALRSLATISGPDDTVILFVSGHGYRGRDNKLYLVGSDTQPRRIEETSLAWDSVAEALKGVKARILVFIDACHSGAVPNGGSNDEIAGTLSAQDLRFTVLAAAKGRQESFERSDLRAGIFTHAILQAITNDRPTVDLNKNGVIELSELYAHIKPQVLTEMRGAQTPWLARVDVIGEVPLF